MPKDHHRLRLNELRGLAILAVVLIHLSATYLYLTHNPLTFAVLLTINQWARFCVPLFFMMTGMVLYSNYGEGKINYVVFMIKRLRYIIIPYFLWAIIYGYIRHKGLDGGGIQTIRDWVIDVASGRISYHLYFIAVMVQLYLIFPLLRPLLRPPYSFVILLLSFLIYIGQTISLWMQLRGDIIWPTWYKFILDNNNMVSWWLFYFILGTLLSQRWPTWEWLIEKKLSSGNNSLEGGKFFDQSRKNNIVLFLLIISLSSILYWMVNTASQAFTNWPEGFPATANFFRISVLIYTLIFVAVALLWARSNWFNKPLEFLGRYSFGIYLSHVLFLEYGQRWLKVFSLSTVGQFIMATIIVFTGSISLAVLATRIPGVKWLVGKPQALENRYINKVDSEYN